MDNTILGMPDNNPWEVTREPILLRGQKVILLNKRKQKVCQPHVLTGWCRSADIPLIPSIRTPTNPEISPSATRPTNLNEFELERGKGGFQHCENFVDLDAIAAGTEGKVLKPQGDDEGCLKFDFLENFQLAT